MFNYYGCVVIDPIPISVTHVCESLQRTAVRRKRLYDTRAVNRKFPVGSWVLRYYPPAAQHKLGYPWVGPQQVVRQATGHTVGIQKDPEKPIVFVHMDDLKLCLGPRYVQPDPSVDVSGWEDKDSIHTDSNVLIDLDRPIDLTGHILSPFYLRRLHYQDNRFHPIAHLMCYRYAIPNDQKTFATGIRKWSKHLTEFPTPKFMTLDCVQQWQSVLVDIYSHLCLTDVAFKTMLINTLHETMRILVNVRVLSATDRLTPCRWLVHRQSHPGTWRALLAHS